MTSTTIVSRPRAGRPRIESRKSDLPPREEILDAAAGLFVNQGFAGTSTREIAESVGIRQASLYHHFQNKDEILEDLLLLSVRPSLDKVEKIEVECPGDVPEAALYLLTLVDVHTLATVPHNIGRLYAMPDVMMNVVYGQFQPARRDLAAAYGRLGAKVVSERVAATVGIKQLGGMLIEQAETVIRSRADGDKMGRAEANAIAAACLRVCGVPQDRIDQAAAVASDLMSALIEERCAR